MADGRIHNGGARPGAGRKSDALRDELFKLIEEAIPPDHWIEIIKVIGTFARAGNLRAAGFLLDRKFGKPTQTVEIDDGQEAASEYDLSRLDPEELATFERLLAKTARTDESGAVPSKPE